MAAAPSSFFAAPPRRRPRSCMSTTASLLRAASSFFLAWVQWLLASAAANSGAAAMLSSNSVVPSIQLASTFDRTIHDQQQQQQHLSAAALVPSSSGGGSFTHAMDAQATQARLAKEGLLEEPLALGSVKNHFFPDPIIFTSLHPTSSLPSLPTPCNPTHTQRRPPPGTPGPYATFSHRLHLIVIAGRRRRGLPRPSRCPRRPTSRGGGGGGGGGGGSGR